MIRLLLSTVIVGVALSIGTTGTASAGNGHHFHGGPYGYGYLYQAIVPESIPYFAQFPPVYYSGPVARPYGWSPYAYPPGVLTPEPKPAPEVTVNPFVPRDRDAKPRKKADEHITSRPALRFVNPYVVQTRGPRPSEFSQTRP